ncbi:transposase [Rhodopirellula sp. SWK7]|uniref:transposase n=1 Tax=Rhodopirellula sp. SWK7 TaxID=595460 RepID=UPI000347C817|nr:transposase [Rhodopirellula sp. SWK7]
MRTSTWKQRKPDDEVAGHEFVWGFTQHVLPSRLQKIRYHGWTSPNSRTSPKELRWLLAITLGWPFTLAEEKYCHGRT